MTSFSMSRPNSGEWRRKRASLHVGQQHLITSVCCQVQAIHVVSHAHCVCTLVLWQLSPCWSECRGSQSAHLQPYQDPVRIERQEQMLMRTSNKHTLFNETAFNVGRENTTRAITRDIHVNERNEMLNHYCSSVVSLLTQSNSSFECINYILNKAHRGCQDIAQPHAEPVQ